MSKKFFSNNLHHQATMKLALMRRVMMHFVFVVLAACSACEKPTQPAPQQPRQAASGVYVLCEGLWRQDNSTLSRYDDSTHAVTNDFFSRVNVGLRLGDTGNQMARKGDTLFITMTVSRTIEVVRISTGAWLGRIRFAGTRQEPRSIAIVNDSVAFVSLLNDDSIAEFNPTTFVLRGASGGTGSGMGGNERIAVGPAPEAVAATDRFVFVANSGYGDYRAKEPKAGTVSVLDVATRKEIHVLEGLPNVTSLVLTPDRSRLYAGFRHLLSQKDSLGGIVEFDAATLQERRRWRLKSPFALCLNGRGSELFCLADSAVYVVNVGEQTVTPRMLVRTMEANAHWYGLGVHPTSGDVWVANARNYVVAGEVLVYSRAAVLVRRFDVGLNPNSFLFF